MEALLRLLWALGLITLIVPVIFWVITGDNYLDLLD